VEERPLMFPDAKQAVYCDATRETDGSLIVWLHGEGERPRYRVSGEVACALVDRVLFALSNHNEGGAIRIRLRPGQDVHVNAGQQPGTCLLTLALGKSVIRLEMPRSTAQELADKVATLGQ